MSSLSSLVEFRNSELYLFDSLVKRHTEMPWLFSATDMHKACKSPIHSAAKKKGKEPSVYFQSKQPVQWLRFNLLNDEERIAKVAGRLREKIKEYGPGMGLVELDRKSKLSALSLLSNLSDLESIVYTKRGGAKGEAGTYVSLHVLLAYSSFLSVNLKDAILDVITSVISGEVETVTEQTTKARNIAKGTPAREENLVFTNRFYEACHRKGLNPRIQIGHVNTFILGMSKKEYMLKNDIDEPFNDNAPEDIIWLKNGALRAATMAIMDSGDKITNAQGKVLMKGICDYVLKHSSAKTIERVAAALREKPSWVKAASEY